ncbi:CCR4-NOT regulatory complex component [Physocladia obscura]|uniref:CCR4-NOT regulatory complex component n=1 Tax=Physocladia obscura TaxID=109957 RepID=A0AAD5SYG5_9FUNG|nr:CCR4-NOT regulatory complex component [Physocladia obscura]
MTLHSVSSQQTDSQRIQAHMAQLPPTTSAVQLVNFSFSFGPDAPKIIQNVNLEVPRGSTTLLIGANGAGKSSLLRLLAGKTLTKDHIRVLGKHPFFEGNQVKCFCRIFILCMRDYYETELSFETRQKKLYIYGITYLGTEWAHNPIVRRDVPVSRLLKTLGAERHQERCSRLLDIMDVNVDWHMHEVSDGQRRRVQIVLGLMEPWNILLLDEVTVDLDVLVRKDLIDFLKEEATLRNATVIYATHIFDGLGGWPSHVVHISEGKIDIVREIDGPQGFPELEEMRALTRKAAAEAGVTGGGSCYEDNSALLRVVERWLREDYKYRSRTSQRTDADGMLMTRWQMLSENMKEYGDKFYNYWNQN